jgi:FdhD protein
MAETLAGVDPAPIVDGRPGTGGRRVGEPHPVQPLTGGARRAVRPVDVTKLSTDGATITQRDLLSTEEPLDIRVRPPAGEPVTLAVTMRTPGDDAALAVGFLFSEGVLRCADDVEGVTADQRPQPGDDRRVVGPNVVVVALRQPVRTSAGLARHSFTSSACGICGRAGVEDLLDRLARPERGSLLDAQVLGTLPKALRAGQAVFDVTGGLHGAAIFTRDGRLMRVAEDVGRHNAVDKVVGWALVSRETPLKDHILMVSGRCGFEIVQKAIAAGIGVVCSVSAPTSLAVDLARAFDVTLIGFLRGTTSNVYSGAQRIALDSTEDPPAGHSP